MAKKPVPKDWKLPDPERRKVKKPLDPPEVFSQREKWSIARFFLVLGVIVTGGAGLFLLLAWVH